LAISEQAGEINIVLRGHYAYYGVAGNLRSLVKVYRVVEREAAGVSSAVNQLPKSVVR